MKIIRIDTFLINPPQPAVCWATLKPLLFVRLETDSAITGWGEAYTLTGRATAMSALIQSLGAELIEREISTPNAFRVYAYREFADRRTGIDFYCAVSAVEIALWDCLGKHFSAPVYQLLGGALARKIPLYANVYSDLPRSAGETVKRIQDLKRDGFFAFKIYPLLLPSLIEAEELVMRTRETLGPDVDMMIDLNAMDDGYKAIEAGQRFEPYRPFWFEEPVSSEELTMLKHVRSKLKMRLVSGERHGGIRRFKEMLEHQAVDVLNPDISGCGGILELMNISSMADAYSVGVTPHCYNSMTVSFAAMLHVSAVIPNLVYAEYFPHIAAVSDVIATTTFKLADGFATVSDAPGLGVEMNESALHEYRVV